MRRLTEELCKGCQFEGRWDSNTRCCDYAYSTGRSRYMVDGKPSYDAKKYCDKYCEKDGKKKGIFNVKQNQK